MSKKGILLCSGGFSTTVIMQKLNAINDLDIVFTAEGVTGNTWEDSIGGNEIVLVSPQIRFIFDDIKAECDKKGIFVFQIPPLLYNPMKSKELWAEIKKAYQ